MKTLSCILAIFINTIVTSFGQQSDSSAQNAGNDIYTKFINITTSDGLSSNEILDFLQDHTGVMWIATKNGLNKMAGDQIVIYQHTEDTNSISDNLITAIAEDTSGNIWVGTGNGLNVYDRKTDRFKRFFSNQNNNNSLSDNVIRSIYADRRSHLWIETQESVLNRLNINSLKFDGFVHAKMEVEGDYFYFQIVENKDGLLFIGGRNYPLLCFNPSDEKFQPTKDILGSHVFFTGRDNELFFAWNNKLFLQDSFDRGAEIVWDNAPDIRAASCDGDGNIWAGGSGYGVYRLNPSDNTLTLFKHNPENPWSLVSDYIYKIYHAHDGNIWIGTQHGISVFSPALNTFRHYRHLNSEVSSLHSDKVTALLQDKTGLIWVGTDDNGVDTFSQAVEQFGNLKYELLNDPINPDVFRKEKEILKQYARHDLIKFNNPGSKNENWTDWSVYRKNFELTRPVNENKISALYEDKLGNIWIGLWAHVGFNRYDTETNSFKRYALFNDENASETPWDLWGANWYNDFLEDTKGRFWINTWEGLGLNRFDRDKGVFEKKSFISMDYPMQRCINNFFLQNQRYLWISGCKYIGFLDLETDQFTSFVPLEFIQNPALKYIKLTAPGTHVADIKTFSKTWRLAQTKDSCLWISCNTGLIKCDLRSLKFNFYQKKPNDGQHIPDNEIVDLVASSDSNHLWLAMTTGLGYFNTQTASFTLTQPTYLFPGEITNDQVLTVRADYQNNIWFSTLQGLVKMNLSSGKSEFFDRTNSNLPNNIVKAILPDGDSIWLGTEDGLAVYQIKNGTIRLLQDQNFSNSSLSCTNITCVARDHRNRVWVGTVKGLNIIDLKNRTIKKLFKNDTGETGLPDNHINGLFNMGIGMWIGTDKGFCYYIPENDSFVMYNQFSPKGLSNRLTTRIIEDRNGYLWVGTTEIGVNRVNPETVEVDQYFEKSWDKSSLSGNNVECLFEDDSGSIWIGTEKALNLWLPDQNGFKKYDQSSGLPSSHIKAILQDNEGHLWISTVNGISCFNQKSNSFTNFYNYNGLQDNEFTNAHTKLSNGDLAFGGSAGFNVFTPEKIDFENNFPPLVLFNLTINDSLFYADATDLEFFDLTHKQNTISLEFGAANYISPSKIRYRYRLSGLETEWSEVTAAKRLVKYSHLPPGKYRFEFTSTNEYGRWNPRPKQLAFIISEPWWQNIWFRLVGIILVFVLFYTILKFREFRLKRSETRLKLQVAHKTEELSASLHQLEESEKKLKQLNQTKDKFFSIISHDLKNPVYALKQVSGILSEKFYDLEEGQKSELINSLHRSIDHTERLLSNLLLWSVSQKGQLKFSPIEINLCGFCNQIVDLHQLGASQKNIHLSNLIAKNESVFADGNMLSTILHNLISNAIKFTGQGGKVELRSTKSGDWMTISVTDTGKGVSQQNIEKLFKAGEKFKTTGTANEEGTGLGLILCKELIEIQGGKIWVESVEGCGSTFYLILPTINKDKYGEDQDNSG